MSQHASSSRASALTEVAPSDALTWCEIDVGALQRNAARFRRWVRPDARLGVVVKSNAYGHGLVASARAFLAGGADWLIVNAVHEATKLRAAGVGAPLLVVGNTAPSQVVEAVESGARLTVYDSLLVAALGAEATRAGVQVPIHIKIETGNYRQGLSEARAVALGVQAAATPGILVEGLSTHFSDIEDTTEHRFAMRQFERFEQARGAFTAAGVDVPITHAANSAATILFPRLHGDLVRVGISAYGHWPSTETYATALARKSAGDATIVPDLEPAMAWRCRVIQVKDVPAGEYIGYGRTFRATHPMRVAVLPVGYYEGYDRRLSSLAHVLIDGARAPVRGRICMNMAMVDVTHIRAAQQGSVATLIGRDGDERVTAETVAGWMSGINYEVVSRIHPEVPRVPHGG